MPTTYVHLRRERSKGSDMYFIKSDTEKTESGPYSKAKMLKRLRRYNGHMPYFDTYLEQGLQNDVRKALSL